MKIFVSASRGDPVDSVIEQINKLSAVNRSKMDSDSQDKHLQKLLSLYDQLREVQMRKQLKAAK